MKNLEQIFSELGIEIPEDKVEALNKAHNENYRTIEENKKDKAELKKSREEVATLTEALKSFEGINPDEIKGEVEKWQKKAEEIESNYLKQIEERDYNDALEKAISGYKFSSDSAKRSVMSDIKASGIPFKDGKLLGFEDAINSIKEKDAGAFIDDEAEKLKQKAVKFTTQSKTVADLEMTKDKIMAIKDRDERRKAIAENPQLFN